jgi:hypothetical protein
VASAILILAGLVLFGSSGRDDSHLTYWPAHTLANSGHIVNYNGDRIEQSSSVLHVATLAALHRLTAVDVVTIGTLFSAAMGGASTLALFFLVRRTASQRAAWASCLIAATAPYLVYWSYGALEATFASVLGILMVVAAADYCAAGRPSIVAPVLAILALALVRPEMPLVLIAFFSGALLLVVVRRTDPVARRRVTVLFAVSASAFGLIATVRLAFFGRIFPQPVYAKSFGLVYGISRGFEYLVDSATSEPGSTMGVLPLLVGTSAIYLAWRQLRAPQIDWSRVFALSFCGAYLGFVLCAGGDWMEAGRLIVPVLPMLVSFIPIAIDARTTRLWPLLMVSILCCILNAVGLVVLTRQASSGAPIWAHLRIDNVLASHYSWFERRSRLHARDIPMVEALDTVVARLVAHHTPVRMLTGQMGMVAYHVSVRHPGKLQFLDRWGLTDRTFTDCPVTAALERLRPGLNLPFKRYFAMEVDLRQRCAIEPPDIIFENGSDPDVPNYGYVMVYTQTGFVHTEPHGLDERPQAAGAFIAVRADLHLPPRRLRCLRWTLVWLRKTRTIRVLRRASSETRPTHPAIRLASEASVVEWCPERATRVEGRRSLPVRSLMASPGPAIRRASS